MSPVVDPAAAAARFIADPAHEETHDRLVWGLRQHRDKAVAAIPEWGRLRDLASRLKEHTLTHLDSYLEQFEANATKLGAVVHWARDAAEHNAIVLQIFRDRGVRRVVKSKSMLQEECGMMPFLAGHGVEVAESDLGERIQQLDHQGPSHIFVPAIHKLRTDIAELFAHHLGTDPNDSEPHHLCEAMRANARPRFLQADAAMTGANFAVAETGGFVVCTNEGNADIGATLPGLHVASVGIEKLVPRARDLGVFVRMLARSGLGSAMTQYTSHFHGPKPGGELHIVLVDNLRSARLGSADFWEVLKCIRCGACMNTCPVYRRSGGLAYGATYSGPIGVVLDPAFDHRKFAELPFHSTLCGSCTEVCPVKIDVAGQIAKWREVIVAEGLLPPDQAMGLRILEADLARPAPPPAAGAEAVGHAAVAHLPGAGADDPRDPWARHRGAQPASRPSFRDWYAQNRGQA